MHDLAHLQVIRAVMLDELVALVIAHVFVKAKVRLIDRRIGWARVVLEDSRREELVVAGQPDQVVVARDHPQLVLFVPMHRIFVAQPAVISIGIGDDFRSEHIVLKRAAHDSSSWTFSLISSQPLSGRSRSQCGGAPALSSSTAIAFASLCWSPVVHCTRMRAAVAAQYKFRRVGTALAMHSSLARAQLPLPISRTISCHRCQLFAEIETDSCAASPTIGIPFGTSPFAAHSPCGARSGGPAAPSSSVAMALASLCRSPVVHCTRMRAAVAAQYKLRLVGTALAMHSSFARAQSSLPIARAILCHRCHLSAEIETASCARSTPMASPFTANARGR